MQSTHSKHAIESSFNALRRPMSRPPESRFTRFYRRISTAIFLFMAILSAIALAVAFVMGMGIYLMELFGSEAVLKGCGVVLCLGVLAICWCWALSLCEE